MSDGGSARSSGMKCIRSSSGDERTTHGPLFLVPTRQPLGHLATPFSLLRSEAATDNGGPGSMMGNGGATLLLHREAVTTSAGILLNSIVWISRVLIHTGVVPPCTQLLKNKKEN